jgi:lipopolysaccharide transport system ATP-binding protein
MEAGEKILEGEPKLVVGHYQRLVNASDDGAAKIKAEILAMGGVACAAPAVEMANVVNTSTVDISDIEENDGLADYFDPNLKSETVIELESLGALISDVHVTTLRGKRVNVLRPRKRYVYRYLVTFRRSVNNVGFGMLIKTVNGFELGGIATAFEKSMQIEQINSGDAYNVAFEFDASLAEGRYFMNAGVVANVEGSLTYLHRFLDIISIRVVSPNLRISTGVVDFGGHALVVRQLT